MRQSMDRDGTGLAVARQREACAKLCADRGWEPVEYVDNDVSASNGKTRPSYTRMLADIAAGRIGAVVVWDLDRLHRRPIELADVFTTRYGRLVRGSGYPPHPERFAAAGFDLAALLDDARWRS